MIKTSLVFPSTRMTPHIMTWHTRASSWRWSSGGSSSTTWSRPTWCPPSSWPSPGWLSSSRPPASRRDSPSPWPSSSPSHPCSAARGGQFKHFLYHFNDILIVRSVPRVSYVTCLDMWMVTCILLIFIELVEFSSIFLLNKNSRSKLINIIDKAALILLPVIFVVFNLFYWPYLLDPTHEDMDIKNK